MKTLSNFFKKSAVAIGISAVFPLIILTAFNLLYKMPHYPGHNDTLSHEEQAAVRKNWQKEHEKYNFYYFCFTVIAGSLAILAGALVNVDFIASGFIVGGVFSILTGFAYYWSYLQKFFQLGALVAALLMLIFCGYYFIERQKNKE